MTVSLPKGGNLLLVDEAPGLEQVRVGIGWGDAPGVGAIELDGVVSLVSAATPQGQLVLVHQIPNPSESLGAHPPSGPIVGDAEKVVVTLAAVPAEVRRLLFSVVIYDATARRQTFRSVRGVYIRLLDDANGIEIARYTLEQVTGSETAMVLGELYRHSRGWKFRAVGQGYTEGVRGVAGVARGDLAVARPVDVDAFLRRTSTARSRRTLAEHLNPPKPTAPPPKPPPKAAPPSTSLSHPKRRPVQPPAPAAKRPAARTSSLDLSRPADPPEAAQAAVSPAPVVFGEHSSRYRQRMEHVSALDDNHPVTAWTEAERGTGAMTVTLRWEPLQTASGLPRPSDLQLGCFWQAMDRSAGVIQTLGNVISAPGELGPRQVLRLGRRDERDGQTIFVDLAALPTFRRFFVFVYGQHGSPEWALQRPALTVAAPSGDQLTIRLGDAPPSARLCVAASFHVVAGDLIIRRENDYVDGVQSEAAARYGFPLEWNSAGMTPRTR